MAITATTIQTRKRAFRASFMPIAAKCPAAAQGGFGLSIRAYEDGTAQGGSAVHKACEYLVKHGRRPADLAPLAAQYHCDPDYLGRGTWYAEQFWQQHGGNFERPHTEEEMHADLPGGEFCITGHMDVYSVPSAVLGRVLDWKSGFRTDADAKEQMRAYAYLVGRTYNLDRVQATVVWLRDQTYQSWEWTSDELVEWAFAFVEHVNGGPGRYVAGDHCRYCPSCFSCPAQREIAANTIASLQAIDPGNEIELRRMGDLYPAVQHVERLCETYRSLMRTMIQTGGPLELAGGRKLQLADTNRREIDPLKGWAIMASRFETTEDMASFLTVGITEMLRMVAEKAPRGQKGESKKALMAELEAAGAVATKTTQSLRVVRGDQTATTEGE